jgi:hypothetical protein
MQIKKINKKNWKCYLITQVFFNPTYIRLNFLLHPKLQTFYKHHSFSFRMGHDSALELTEEGDVNKYINNKN